MSRGNLSGLEASIERPCGLGNTRTDASTSSTPWVPRISYEVLRDLGMSDGAIAQYFCRFRHGQLEQFVRMVLHKRGWNCRRWRGHMSNEGAVSWPKGNTTRSRQRVERRLA